MYSLALVGFSADASLLLAVGGAMSFGGGSVHWINADSLETEFTLPRTHGTPKSWAMSPDRGLIATGSSDGFVKVWDVDERRQVHEIYLGETQVQGVAFINDVHLAVALGGGGIYAYTLDPVELLKTMRASLTRGFTVTDCERFNSATTAPLLPSCTADRGSVRVLAAVVLVDHAQDRDDRHGRTDQDQPPAEDQTREHHRG